MSKSIIYIFITDLFQVFSAGTMIGTSLVPEKFIPMNLLLI